jgi:hypothetical protein
MAGYRAREETTAMKKKKQDIGSCRDFFSRVGWGGFGVFSFLS